MVVIHILEVAVEPPTHLPDLFVVLNVLVSTSCFVVALIYLYLKQFEKDKVE